MAAGIKQTYHFGEYSLDPEEFSLIHDGKEIPLRPKTFTILLHLLEHHGHLVTKEEFLTAVWLETYVTDKLLSRSIWELRQALEPEGEQSG